MLKEYICMQGVTKTVHLTPVMRYFVYGGINIATAMAAAISSVYLPGFNPFLIFIPEIAFFAWSGGFIGGFSTTIISIIFVTLMIFYPTNHPIIHATTNLVLETAIFFFVSTFVSYVIHEAKDQEKIFEYQKRLRNDHHIIETLEKSYENAETEIKARDQFLAIASHELKTPVTSMLLQVQTAIHNIRNVSLANFSVATLLKMLEDTEQQSKRLSKMVNDLLDISLITTGKIDLEPEETNISEITVAVVERYLNRPQNKNQISLLVKKPVFVYCDKLRMEQVVVNLLSNAIKYGKNKPIIVEVRTSGSNAQIIVSDQGIGIPLEQQKKIFNRFERAVSPRDYKGLGVGLYITYQIIQAHNGNINLVSYPNQGSIFTIELPLKKTKN